MCDFKNIRKLKADEIECRVATTSQKGCSLLLYKTARVDRAILDEVASPMNWQNDFKVIDGKMYGGIAVLSDNGQWIWKWDCGTESNTEAEKGQASDCFKRAGFKWGIGIELYSAPFIWIPLEMEKNDKGKWVVPKGVDFRVKSIDYAENGNINKLEIENNEHKIVYSMSTFLKPEKELSASDIDSIAAKEVENQEADKFICSSCGAVISKKIADYSAEKYGKQLCFKCQKQQQKVS